VDFYEETGWPVAIRRRAPWGPADVEAWRFRVAAIGVPVDGPDFFCLRLLEKSAVKFCPFCGSKEILVLPCDYTAGFWARCTSCESAGPRNDHPGDAEYAWQLRHFLPATETDFKPFEKE